MSNHINNCFKYPINSWDRENDYICCPDFLSIFWQSFLKWIQLNWFDQAFENSGELIWLFKYKFNLFLRCHFFSVFSLIFRSLPFQHDISNKTSNYSNHHKYINNINNLKGDQSHVTLNELKAVDSGFKGTVT